jgi:Planctomycete cytochrome C
MKPLTVLSLFVFLLSVNGAEPPVAPPPRAKPTPLPVAPAPHPKFGPAPGEPEIEFNRDVRPILAENCFACHGFDAKSRKARLRLDTPDGARAERDNGPAITPGDPRNSLVWERITTPHADGLMPPPETKKTLTAAQKETLRLWIKQGAPYQKHWAFADRPCRKSAIRIPQSAIPSMPSSLHDFRRKG